MLTITINKMCRTELALAIHTLTVLQNNLPSEDNLQGTASIPDLTQSGTTTEQIIDAGPAAANVAVEGLPDDIPVIGSTPAPAPAAAPVGDVDSAGIPWDKRIHSDAKGVKSDGTWKKRRNLADGVYETVMAELRAGLAGNQQQAPATSTPPADAQQAAVSPSEEAGQPPVAGQPIAGQEAGQPPVNTAPAPTPAPAPAAGDTSHVTQQSIVTLLPPHLVAGRITPDVINQILAANVGLDGQPAPHVGALVNANFSAAFPNIVAQINMHLAMQGAAL